MSEIKIKRAYDPVEESDGERILVDRLWPRGISKEKISIKFWAKEIAPSQDLRKWFNHEEEKYPEFRTRYRKELEENETAADFIQEVTTALSDGCDVTLLYGAKDREHNNSVVLKEWLSEKL